MSFSAPISLGLFLIFVYVITLLRKVEIHPVNFLFVAAAFFSFNLLFSYTADRLPVQTAFFISSAVSVGLVASYLRLVVGPRFALFEAGVAQLLYQVGFSTAHFFDGYTGLSITVLVILTLFLLMQLTGRVSWSTVFQSR
jgi:inner membrane protein involved in colicin E2 resistance